MSKKNFQRVADRKIYREWQAVTGSAVGYKHFTLVGVFGGTEEITEYNTTLPVGAYQGVDASGNPVTIGNDTTAANIELLRDPDVSADTYTYKVQPFLIKNRKVHYYVKNNHTNVVNLVVYHVKPRKDLPITLEQITSSDFARQVLETFQIVEGIADKSSIAAIKTDGITMHHNTTQTATNGAVPFGTQVFNECSFKPFLTPFDSSYFVEQFKVVDVKKVRLRPGDTLDLHYNLGDLKFPDGIHPFLGSGYHAFAFEDHFAFQQHGDISHEVAYGGPPKEAAADPTNDRESGLKTNIGSNQRIGHNSTFLDVLGYYEAEIVVHSYEMQLTGHHVSVNSLNNAGDMTDSMTEVAHTE